MARTDTVVRGAPSVSGEVIKDVSRAERVDVIATVRDSDWVLVAQNGIGLGYLQSDALADEPQHRQPAAQHATAARKQASSRTQDNAAKPPIASSSPPRTPAKQKTTAVAADESPATGTKPAKSIQAAATKPAPPPASTETDTTQAARPLSGDGKPAQPAVQQVAGPSSVDGANLKKASVTVECKVVTRTIEVPSGPSAKENVKFCKEPPRDWRMVALRQDGPLGVAA